MKTRKKIIALAGGVVCVALTLLIFYFAVNETVNGIVISWMAGVNIVLIACILVWCGLDLEKR